MTFSRMNEEWLTFRDHVAELRRVILNVLAIIAVGIGISLFFYQELFSLFSYPLKDTSNHLEQQQIVRKRILNPTNQEQIYNDHTIPAGGHIEIDVIMPPSQLVILTPLEGIASTLKMSFLVGIAGTSPIWIYVLLRFIFPALKPREKHFLVPFMALSVLFVAIGISFAFFVTIPLINRYLHSFNQGLGDNFWSLSQYVDYTVMLLFANICVFEFGMVLFLLIYLNVFTADQLINKRRHLIVFAFIIGALLTPPDVLSQLLLALPIISFYELAILYARFKKNSF